MNRNSKLYPLVCLITGAIIIAAGIYTLSAGDVILHVASLIGGGVVTVQGAGLILSAILKRKNLSKAAMGNVLFGGFFNDIKDDFTNFFAPAQTRLFSTCFTCGAGK